MDDLYSPLSSRRVLIPAVSTSFYLRSPDRKQLTVMDKIVFFSFKTPCILYWVGGLAFLVSSILFYPFFNAPQDPEGMGDAIGSRGFVLGSLTFLVGSCIEVYHAVPGRAMSSHGLLQWAPILSSMMNTVGSAQFVVGSLYFMPVHYDAHPSLGCSLFISGCLCFCLSILADFTRFSTSELSAAFQWGDLVSVWFLAAVVNFAGNLLFISGCYFYLPQFLQVGDPAIAAMNLTFATNQFVVGSLCFALAPLLQIYNINHDINDKSICCRAIK
ncbi:hypothetical protein DYB30_005457 [Aphanomyces astaci]|uniref:YrhK domain-containing protein n=1 Tax=Aphanomyces astaci TaxID=112090 RepID=A0A397FH28_APHAT|nr:hypothetical protein DYB30_005457 [Aphanomyces astaci]RHZ32521.1 hypothetical protein DYB31_011844 [Aphanomyces astaci]